jgi:tetratricopeptide (TPR) repeat protein
LFAISVRTILADVTEPREQILRTLAEYQKLLEERPDDARMLLKAGDLQLRADDTVQALTYFCRAAEAFAKSGQHFKALAVGEHILHVIQDRAPEKAATITDIARLMATSYRALGRVDEAIKISVEGAEALDKAGLTTEATELRRSAGELSGAEPHSG